MLADSVPFADEDEGEAFDFDDSGDDIPEADRPCPAPPAPPAPSSEDQSQDNLVASHPEDPSAPSLTPDTAPSSADTTVATSRAFTADGATAEGEGTSAAEGTDDTETDLPPPPPPLNYDAETDPARTGLWPKSVDILFGSREVKVFEPILAFPLGRDSSALQLHLDIGKLQIMA